VVVVHMSLSSTSEDRRPCILPNLPSHTASRSFPSFLFLFKGNLKTHAEAWAGERHKTLQKESPAHRDRKHSCIHRRIRSDKAMPSTTQRKCSYFQRLTPYYQSSVNSEESPEVVDVQDPFNVLLSKLRPQDQRSRVSL